MHKVDRACHHHGKKQGNNISTQPNNEQDAANQLNISPKVRRSCRGRDAHAGEETSNLVNAIGHNLIPTVPNKNDANTDAQNKHRTFF